MEDKRIRILGKFFPNSTLVSVNSDFEEYLDSLDKLKKVSEVGAQNDLNMYYEKRFVGRFEVDDLQKVLTVEHEIDHFRLFTSTPFGLLVWRIFQCVSVNLHYLDRKLNSNPAYNDIQVPYIDWLINHEKELMDSFDGSDENFGIIWGVIMETKLIQDFLGLLLGHRDTTIGHFLDVANMASQLLAIRSGIQFKGKWISGLPKDMRLTDLFPSISAIEYIEASARLREIFTTEKLDILSHSLYESWKAGSLHGLYLNGFQWLINKLGDPWLAKIGIDIAFSTPIDVAGYKDGGELVIEDILPSFRVNRIVEAMRNCFIPVSESDKLSEIILETIPSMAGLPTLKKTYNELSSQALWENANWGGQVTVIDNESGEIDYNATDTYKEANFLGTNVYYDYVHNFYQNNFKIRLNKGYFFTTSWKDVQVKPMLMFFNDKVDINWEWDEENSEQDILFALQCYRAFCNHTVTAFLIGEGDLNGLKKLDRMLINQIAGKDNQDIYDFITMNYISESVVNKFSTKMASFLADSSE